MCLKCMLLYTLQSPIMGWSSPGIVALHFLHLYMWTSASSCQLITFSATNQYRLFFSRTAALLLYALKAAVTSDFKAALCPSPLSVRRGEVVCFIATHSSPHCSNVEVVIGLQRFPTCYHVTYCSIQLHKCRIIHSFACNYTK